MFRLVKCYFVDIIIISTVVNFCCSIENVFYYSSGFGLVNLVRKGVTRAISMS